MGRVSKGAPCSVSGCNNKGFRSLPSSRVSGYLRVSSSERRIVLCEQHYKQYKKLSKKERELELARYRS